MLMALACLFALIGLAALSLAMDRHAFLSPRRLRFGAGRYALRGVGMVALISSLACASSPVGGAQGTVVWFGLLAPCALVVAIVLAYLSHRPN